jgi:hypothetical protein
MPSPAKVLAPSVGAPDLLHPVHPAHAVRALIAAVSPVLWWAALLVGVLPIAIVALASVLLDVEVQLMTRDVAAIGEVHPLAGSFSSLGILLWWTSASVWLLTAMVVRSDGSRAGARFAMAGGALSVYLALDDLFQFHEALAPAYLGVPEWAVYGALLTAFVAYLGYFRARLVERSALLVLLTLAFLGASACVDLVLNPYLGRLGHWSYLFEDALKWLGICCWTAFAVVWCRAALRARLPA